MLGVESYTFMILSLQIHVMLLEEEHFFIPLHILFPEDTHALISICLKIKYKDNFIL